MTDTLLQAATVGAHHIPGSLTVAVPSGLFDVFTDVPKYDDIVTNLGRIYRFNGAAPWTVLQHSVLAHRVADVVLNNDVLYKEVATKRGNTLLNNVVGPKLGAALLAEVLVHDFAEFVMGDVTRPLKVFFRETGGKEVLDFYEGLCDAINCRFLDAQSLPRLRPSPEGVPSVQTRVGYYADASVSAVLDFVRLCDNIALYLERHHFFGRLTNHPEVWAVDSLFASERDGINYPLFVTPQALELYKAPSIFKLTVDAAEKQMASILDGLCLEGAAQ